MSWRKLRLDEIRKDLKEILNYEAVIYGSYVTGKFKEGPDIGVAVITKVRGEE